jgi:ComF family protein
VNGFLEDFIQLLAPRLCAGCETPAESVFCETCESLLDRAESPEALFVYGGPIADAIHRFKYRGRSDLGEALGSLMGEAALRLCGEVDAVVPVPLHWRRRRWRGYDQAALLARPIARTLGVPALLFGLRRTRHTPSQIDLPHHERKRNVAGAFAARRLEGVQRVLLVDDVRTTGATLGAAAEALRAAGVGEAHTLVLATRVLARGT